MFGFPVGGATVKPMRQNAEILRGPFGTVADERPFSCEVACAPDFTERANFSERTC